MKPFTAAAVLLVGGLVYATSSASAQPAPQQEHSHAPKATQTAQRADFDLRVLDIIAENLEGHLMMNQLAEQKTENPELKATVARIGQDQRGALARVDQVRARLYPNAPKREPIGGVNLSGMGSMGGHGASGRPGGGMQMGAMQKGGMQMGEMGNIMDQMAQLKQLNRAEFDQAFAKAMIRHQEMHAPITEQAIQGAKSEEVRDLAKESLATGKKDIEDLQKFAGAMK